MASAISGTRAARSGTRGRLSAILPPSHSVSMILSVTGARMTQVSCLGHRSPRRRRVRRGGCLSTNSRARRPSSTSDGGCASTLRASASQAALGAPEPAAPGRLRGAGGWRGVGDATAPGGPARSGLRPVDPSGERRTCGRISTRLAPMHARGGFAGPFGCCRTGTTAHRFRWTISSAPNRRAAAQTAWAAAHRARDRGAPSAPGGRILEVPDDPPRRGGYWRDGRGVGKDEDGRQR